MRGRAASDRLARAETELATLERAHGTRLGVAAFDVASGARIGHRQRDRFPMCSTHKLITAAAVLHEVDRGRLDLGRKVPYSAGDLLEYAPITRAHVAAGSMTLGDLCAAAVEWSDNTAANLLLGQIGGPAGWTRYIRSLGDETSRLDRTEPALNTAIPGDPRDTTTPEAMLADLNAAALGSALSRASRDRLQAWMLGGKVTDALLRSGVPAGWRVGDKSGSGANGTRNDVGVLWPSEGSPILIAVFQTGGAEPMARRDRLIAEVGGVVAHAFRG